MLMPLAAGPVVAQTPMPVQTPLAAQEMDGPSFAERFAEGFSGHLNVGYQGGSTRLTDAFGYRAYGEDASFISSYENTGGVMLEAGGSLSVWRELSIRARLYPARQAQYHDRDRHGATPARVQRTEDHPAAIADTCQPRAGYTRRG